MKTIDDILEQEVYEDMTISELLDGERYNHVYKVMDGLRGRINFKKEVIYYNPCFNEDGLTYVHEMLHDYHNRTGVIEPPESIIEQNAQRIYNEYSKLIDDYVYSLHNETKDKKDEQDKQLYFCFDGEE